MVPWLGLTSMQTAEMRYCNCNNIRWLDLNEYYIPTRSNVLKVQAAARFRSGKMGYTPGPLASCQCIMYFQAVGS